jgi:hypothetical protein
MRSEPNLDHRARLRERLIELRDDALGRMLRRCAVEPGHLPLIAGINAALDTLDRMPTAIKAAVRAAALAQRLIAAALPRLSSRIG